MGKKVDLTGQRFGKLVAVKDVGRENNNVLWECLCDCGKHISVASIRLTRGDTKSCGCITTKVDLTGKRFGKWTVLGDIGKRTSSGTVMWNCLCDCGEQKDVSGHSLRRGKSTSCGCSKINNLIGLRFGKLEVKKKVDKKIGTGIVWECLCDCGKSTEVRSMLLSQGITKSCGCLGVPRGINHYKYNEKLTEDERRNGRYGLGDGDFRVWSKMVKDRDNYTCQVCGDNKGGNLNSHHLNAWNAFPKQRFDLENGTTLCTDCHKEFHKLHGNGDNTREQFNEYAASKTLVLN